MIGLLLGGFNPLRGALGAAALLAGIWALCKVCKWIGACRLRDCAVVKRLLRVSGHDPFDDFELMILVHEALYERSEGKLKTFVKITAGAHTVKTELDSNGMFQQPLHIVVEQGTSDVVVELLDSHSKVLATLDLEVTENILNPENLQPEMTYTMIQKGKGIKNPKVKLTMVVASEDDEEMALTSTFSGVTGGGADVDMLVKQQLKKAQEEAQGGSELETLKTACCGPLELFEGLGKTKEVYMAILGPPTTRRWMIGIWKDVEDFEAKNPPKLDVDLLRIQSVQPDPSRHHVFVVNCYDENKVRKALTFRRIDRARDVWVEILHALVTKARDHRKATKSQTFKATKSQSFGAIRSDRSEGGRTAPRRTGTREISGSSGKDVSPTRGASPLDRLEHSDEE